MRGELRCFPLTTCTLRPVPAGGARAGLAGSAVNSRSARGPRPGRVLRVRSTEASPRTSCDHHFGIRSVAPAKSIFPIPFLFI